MVKKINGEWLATCDICGWEGKAPTKEEARTLLARHLDEHRRPLEFEKEKEEESEKISSPELPDMGPPSPPGSKNFSE
jgi:hypothetical protein